MSADVEPRQYWVRSENGKTYGPLTFATIDLFVVNGVLAGRCQVSHDGERYADPGRFSDVRDAFPQEMWGSTEPLPGGDPAVPVLSPDAPAIPTRRGNPIPGLDRTRAPGGPPKLNSAGTMPAAPPKLNTQGNIPVAPPKLNTQGKIPVAPPKLNTQGKIPVAPPVLDPSAVVAIEPPLLDPLSAEAIEPPLIDAEVAPKEVGTDPEAARPAPLASGALGDETAMRVYYKLAAESASGLLRLDADGVKYELWLKKGGPVQVRSDAPADSVANYLGEKGLLTSDAVAKVEAAAPQFGGDPIGAAFALGVVTNPGELMAALSGHGLALLKKVLLLERGAHRFDAGVVAPPTAVPLGNKWALVLQAARSLSGEEARRRLGENYEAPVMKSGHLVTLEELALDAKEARLAASFDGVRSLKELGAQLGDADAVARAGYVLAELELAGFADVAPKAKTPEPAPEPPKPAPKSVGAAPKPGPPPGARQGPPVAPKANVAAKPGPPPGAKPGPPPAVKPGFAPRPGPPPGAKPMAPPVMKPAVPKPAIGPLANVASTDVAQLQEALAALEAASHFEVLGIADNANGAAVKSAYLQMVKSFHPDTVPAEAAPEVRQLREQIFARVNDANTVLSDDAARANYLDELAHGGDEKVDVQKIFAAEDLFTKGCITAKARKYAEALKMFDDAIKLNDREAEFHAWRAWAKFMSASDKRTVFDDAMSGIEHALELMPRCAPAAFFAGEMSKLCGDTATAVKWLKKALELDPNHADAARELRHIK